MESFTGIVSSGSGLRITCSFSSGVAINWSSLFWADESSSEMTVSALSCWSSTSTAAVSAAPNMLRRTAVSSSAAISASDCSVFVPLFSESAGHKDTASSPAVNSDSAFTGAIPETSSVASTDSIPASAGPAVRTLSGKASAGCTVADVGTATTAGKPACRELSGEPQMPRALSRIS